MAGERKFIVENIRRVLLREYLMKKTERAGFGGLDIQRTPMGTRISLFIERPGLVIGRGGQAINKLTETLGKEFKFDNPQIEVQEVENPSLNANIMAEKLAVALERGWHFRRAGHSTVRRIMDAGARGCQVVISGKLTGQRHRTEKFKEGHIKYCGEPKLKFMRQGFAVAKLKQGVIGVKVQIMDPTARLPDDIEVTALLEGAEKVEAEVPVVAMETVKAETAAPMDKTEGEPAGEPAAAAKVESAAEVKDVAETEPSTEKGKVVEAAKVKPEAEVKVEVAAKVEPEVPAKAISEEVPKVTPKPESKKAEPVVKTRKKEDKKKVKKPKKTKDLKTKKLKKVARELEKLGEDVDVDIDLEDKAQTEEKKK